MKRLVALGLLKLANRRQGATWVYKIVPVNEWKPKIKADVQARLDKEKKGDHRPHTAGVVNKVSSPRPAGVVIKDGSPKMLSTPPLKPHYTPPLKPHHTPPLKPEPNVSLHISLEGIKKKGGETPLSWSFAETIKLSDELDWLIERIDGLRAKNECDQNKDLIQELIDRKFEVMQALGVKF
jgi:hypothetical protein